MNLIMEARSGCTEGVQIHVSTCMCSQITLIVLVSVKQILFGTFPVGQTPMTLPPFPSFPGFFPPVP